ncbi:GtrA family protein [Nocardioides coralli]|uniref:GtrA family protein n=1 Tax=Nocardioides coralli TaxID=2872154 RepID=UPI001CA464AA|nr:GtrA family protein [Nocardioides coralli]QZY29973.1 GtrA family protein [Nocardioides coralli]
MGERSQRLAGEFGRSAVAGTIASIVAFVLFNLLVHWDPGYDNAVLNDHAITGFVIANVLSTLLTYQLSRSWAFRHREPVGFAGGVVPFFLISGLSLLIPVTCLWVSRNLLGYDSALADNIAANVVGLFLGFVSRFALFRIFVFRRRARTSPEQEPAPRGKLEHQPEA